MFSLALLLASAALLGNYCFVQACDDGPADVYFLLDASATATDVNEMKSFVKTFVGSVKLSVTEYQIGLYRFAGSPTQVFKLNIYYTIPKMRSVIDTVSSIGGQANINQALDTVSTVGFTSNKGGRPSAQKIMVLLTTGKSPTPDLLVRTAEKLRASNITLISVGIGGAVNKTELQEISATPDYAFFVSSGYALELIEDDFRTALRKDIAVPDGCSTNIWTTSPATLSPKDTSCSMQKVFNNTEFQFVELQCTANRVYPEAICEFYQITNGSTPVGVRGKPSYTHTIDRDASSFNSTCTVQLPPEYTGLGSHTFQAYIYPGVAGGKSLVSANQIVGRLELPITYGCDFEEDLCDWLQDPNDDSNWYRNKGRFSFISSARDGLDNYYIYPKASVFRPNERARLMSPQFPPGKRCLHLVYLLNGITINELNVYIETEFNTTKIFRDEGPKGNIWWGRWIDINPHSAYQIVFEGVGGKSDGATLAIDDITVQVGECPLLDPYNCDFEYDLCGWTQETDDDFDWTRNRATTISSATGPSADNTKGNDLGSYIYIETSSPRAFNDQARFISPSLAPGTRCLRFAYHMYGTTVYQLNVYLKTKYAIQKVVALEGDKGNVWRLTSLTINPYYDYQVVFEGIRGSGYNGDLAIDDISMKEGACPSDCPMYPVDVYFVLDASSSVKVDDFNYMQNFVASYAANAASSITGRRIGLYTFSNTSDEVFPLDVYRGTDKIISAIDNVTITGGQRDINQALQTVSTDGFQSNRGGRTSIPDIIVLFTSGPSQRPELLKKTAEKLRTNNITLIIIGYGDTLNVTELQGISSTPEYAFYAVKSLTLDFLQKDFQVALNEAADRGRACAPGTNQWRTSLATALPEGVSCVASKFYDSHQNVYMKLTCSIQRVYPDAICEFYSKIEGGKPVPIQGNLSYVYSLNIGNSTLRTVCTASVNVTELADGLNTFGAFVYPNVPNGRSLVQATDVAGRILLPITPYDCDFEESFCGWTQDLDDDFNWSRKNGQTVSDGTGPDFDHTKFGTSLGYYAYIEASAPRQLGDTARLISSSIPAGQRCLYFFYHLAGFDIGELNVYVQTGSGNMTMDKILGMEGEKGFAWIEARVDIYSNTSYQIVIEGIRGRGFIGDVAIDDITVQVGECPPFSLGPDSSFDCNFEYGLCGWTQDDTDDFDWLNNQDQTSSDNTGPSADKMGNDRGVYLYLEATREILGAKARLISSPVSPGEQCVRFFYHMYGDHIAELNVYIGQTGSNMTQIFGEQGNKGDRWLEASVSINPNATSQIIIETVRGTGFKGDIAIDDVSLTVGNCFTAAPDDVTCVAKEVTSNGNLKLVNLKCTANQVYPEAVCMFYKKTDDGVFVPIKAKPNYVHNKDNDTMSYNTTCEISLYPKELGEGRHNFQALVYPNAEGGRNMVNATKLDGTVKLWHAEVKYDCPESLLDDYFCGKPTYCNCTVVMEGWPKGSIAWFEDVSFLRPNPLQVMFDENDPDAYYHCQSVSQIGRSPGSILKIETDISCS